MDGAFSLFLATTPLLFVLREIGSSEVVVFIQTCRPQVSSVEASASALRLEELTAVLESQQRELELLRASKRPIPSAREQQHKHQQEEKQRETARGDKSAPQMNPLTRTCFNEYTSAIREGTRSGNLVSDRKERGRTGNSTADYIAGCSDRMADGNSMADDDSDRTLIASDARGTPVSGAEKDNSPAGQARAAVSAKRRSTGEFKADSTANSDPAPELNRDDTDSKRHSGASFTASPTMTMTTRPRPQKPKPLLGIQREGEGTGEGEGAEQAESPAAEPLPVVARARKLEGEGDLLPTKEGELRGRRVRDIGAICGYKGRQDETCGDVGLRRTRATIGADGELPVRVRRCEEESCEWEKEATCLRAERRDLFRRLRTLGREGEEKVRDWSSWRHNSRA